MPYISVYIQDGEIIKWVDEMVKKKEFRSRSHAVEKALKELKKKYESSTVRF